MTENQRKRARKPSYRLRIEGKTVGDAPGTLRASPAALEPVMDVTCVGPDKVLSRTLDSVDELSELREAWPLVWVNVVGVGDADLVGELGQLFDLHALALEDVLNVHQRPKCEDYASSVFVVSRVFHQEPEFAAEQVSMFFGTGFVLTFQEYTGDWFDPVRRRLAHEGTRLRSGRADYLGYALLDATVDGFFPLLEQYGERLETLEEEVMRGVHSSQLRKIRDIKRELLTIRRTLWSLREALNTLQHSDHTSISEETRLYLRDCHDHSVQLLDIVETFRDLSGALVDIYLSALANRNAEVGKVLTVVATIFLPLTFLAGLYGMNFNTHSSPYNMPELNWTYGYPALLALMTTIAAALVWYFARRGWLDDATAPTEPEAGE